MRISELAAAADLPVATVKYYLREGLLPPGEPTSATRATYDETHLTRLRLVRALIDVGGLSHAQVQAVLTCLESGSGSLHETLGSAHMALTEVPDDAVSTGRAEEIVAGLGWRVDPDTPALVELDRALDAVRQVGLPTTEETVHTYARAAAEIAEAEVAGVPTTSPEDALVYVVTGVVLYAPVLLALRKLAQQDASARRFT